METKIKYSVAGLLGLLFLWNPAPTTAGRVTTPLQASGLTPLWEENFTNGSIDKMQYSWAKGEHTALRSYIMPGAIYFGQEGAKAWPFVEQELNNFKAHDGEPLPSTLEFDVFSPISGSNRLSLRPRRRGDFAHIHLGFAKDATDIAFSNFATIDTTVNYAEKTGPSRGWAHVTVSYQQYLVGGITYARYVVAINEEVREFTAPSGITSPDWLTHWNSNSEADGWSIEYNSPVSTMGRYVANVRAYQGFMTKTEMAARLQGRVAAYVAALPDPRNYHGPTKALEEHKLLDLHGPNALAYPEQTGALTVNFDGSLSSSYDKITSYQWTFGDGASASGRIVNHTYAQPGTYRVELTVVNDNGTDTHWLTFTVQAVFLTPKYQMTAMPGSQVTFVHTLTNVNAVTATYTLAATPDLPGWQAAPSVPTVGPLAPGQSASFVVTVHVPANAAEGDGAQIVVRATSQANNTVQVTTTDSVTVSHPAISLYPVHLPLIFANN